MSDECKGKSEGAPKEDYIAFLRKRVENLEAENLMLRRAILRESAEMEKTYDEIKDRLDNLRATVIRAVIASIKANQRPVTYDEIIRAFRARYPFIKAKTETITRMVRKLKEEGILFSPKQGYFYINKEALKQYKSE